MASTEDVGTVEGRLPLASYCNPRDETEEFCLGKQRERAEKLCGQPPWFSGRCGLWLSRECQLLKILIGSFSFLLFIYLNCFFVCTLCLYVLYKMLKDFHYNDFEFERINVKIDSKALCLSTNPYML